MLRVLTVVVLLGLLPTLVAADTEVKSKADQITITGRVQTQWRHSTIDGEPSNVFFMRRVRATVKVKINDWIDGVVQPDYGDGKTSVKDAYARFKFNDNFQVVTGQAHRRFDMFELTSSTQILVIERDGRIGDTKVPTLSRMTEGLGFSDRDIGVFAKINDHDKRIVVQAGITNGDGANKDASQGEKAYQGRVTFKPMGDQDLRISGGISVKPYEGMAAGEVEYASGFEGSVEFGNFKEGVHIQAGFITGDNWGGVHTTFDAMTDGNSPTFIAAQGIATYKHRLQNNRWIESVEPLVRVSFADPNNDIDDDGGILVTPGLNAFFTNRNRVSVNVDIFLPQDSMLDTEASIKAQSWLYW